MNSLAFRDMVLMQKKVRAMEVVQEIEKYKETEMLRLEQWLSSRISEINAMEGYGEEVKAQKNQLRLQAISEARSEASALEAYCEQRLALLQEHGV